MRTRMHSTGTEGARCGTQQPALTTLQELKNTIEQWEREREEVGVLVAQLKESHERKAAKLKDMARLNMQHIMQHLVQHLIQHASFRLQFASISRSCCSRREGAFHPNTRPRHSPALFFIVRPSCHVAMASTCARSHAASGWAAAQDAAQEALQIECDALRQQKAEMVEMSTKFEASPQVRILQDSLKSQCALSIVSAGCGRMRR